MHQKLAFLGPIKLFRKITHEISVTMQRNHVGIGFLTLLISSAWLADDVPQSKLPMKWERNCTGYTIIEYGKGINCSGDTVALHKIGGLQVLVFEHDNLHQNLLHAEQ